MSKTTCFTEIHQEENKFFVLFQYAPSTFILVQEFPSHSLALEFVAKIREECKK